LSKSATADLDGADPESSITLFWIPGSREDARPGMTVSEWMRGSYSAKTRFALKPAHDE
jgi:hypothetical protein